MPGASDLAESVVGVGLMSNGVGARGVLLVFEGIDGAGKTTQAGLVADWLEESGLDVVRTKEPTDGPYGQRLRDSASTGRLTAVEELAAFIADRREHVRDVIEPGLEAGKVVIVDRYYFSNAAYQGARGMNPREILRANEEFAPPPDLLVILEVDASTGVKRVAARGDKGNLFEREEDLRKCAAIFADIPFGNLLRIDGGLSRENVFFEIAQTLRSGVLFQRLCMKVNKTECEPEQCVFRLAGSCKYVKMAPFSRPRAQR
jgi:dTMP kinase